MPRIVARFEPPANDGLRAAIEEFDCVTLLADDGEEDRGEVMVREFLRSGDCERAVATGTTTTYLVTNADDAPGKLIGYVTLSLTQLRLSGGELKSAELTGARRSDFGAIRIAMIGVDKRFAHDGYGRLLIDTVITHTAHMSHDVSVRFIVADAVNTQLEWYKRRGFVENNSQAERERLADMAERTGIAATSVRLDLGADPRILLDEQAPSR